MGQKQSSTKGSANIQQETGAKGTSQSSREVSTTGKRQKLFNRKSRAAAAGKAGHANGFGNATARPPKDAVLPPERSRSSTNGRVHPTLDSRSSSSDDQLSEQQQQPGPGERASPFTVAQQTSDATHLPPVHHPEQQPPAPAPAPTSFLDAPPRWPEASQRGPKSSASASSASRTAAGTNDDSPPPTSSVNTACGAGGGAPRADARPLTAGGIADRLAAELQGAEAGELRPQQRRSEAEDSTLSSSRTNSGGLNGNHASQGFLAPRDEEGSLRRARRRSWPGGTIMRAKSMELINNPHGLPIIATDMKERAATVESLHSASQPSNDERYQALTRMLCDIFQAPIGGIALLQDDGAQGSAHLLSFHGLTAGEEELVTLFCRYSLIPQKPKVLLVVDTQDDARFRDDQLMRLKGVRFYVGAPLLASNGHRLGTLCLMDIKPRHLDVDSCGLLCNMAELVVRMLEGSSIRPDPHNPRQAQYKFDEKLGHVSKPLLRPLACFKEAVALVDTEPEGWPMAWANEEFRQSMGVVETPSSVWEAFQLPENAADDAMETLQGLVKACLKFNFVAEQKPLCSDDKRDGQHQFFELQLRPAGADAFRKVPTIEIPPVAAITLSPDNGSAAADNSADEGSDDSAVPSRHESLGGRTQSDGVNTCRFYFAALRPLEEGAIRRAQKLPVLQLRVSDERRRSFEGERRRSFEQPIRASAQAAATAARRSSVDIMQPVSETSAVTSVAKKAPDPPKWRMNSLEDVFLGPLLGRGSYGRVYRGICNGRRVAVKVIESVPGSKEGKELAARLDAEGEFTSRLHHPHVVQTLGYGTWGTELPDRSSIDSKLVGGRTQRAGSTSDSYTSSWDDDVFNDPEQEDEQKTESWVVMEYCNKGSLEQAVERGVFQQKSAPGKADLLLIIPTALEIASAMAYLHDNDVIHGDLSGSNVLLKNHSKSSRGFVAKVGDFGLSRFSSSTGSAMVTGTQGTLTHCAPERLTGGILTKAADVYSFGVLLWEMYTGERAWAGVRAVRVMTLATTANHGYLQLAADAPTPYKALVEACVSREYAQRPSFRRIVSDLRTYAERLGLTPSASASPTAKKQVHQPVTPRTRALAARAQLAADCA